MIDFIEKLVSTINTSERDSVEKASQKSETEDQENLEPLVIMTTRDLVSIRRQNTRHTGYPGSSPDECAYHVG